MTNYRRGYAHEDRARKNLEAQGYYVMRSAGSKGKLDLLAKMPMSEEPWLAIQCGLGHKSKAERKQLVALAVSIGARPVLIERGQIATFLDETGEFGSAPSVDIAA